MSALFRGEILDWVINAVSISNDPLFNWILAGLLASILYAITFRMVGVLYSADVISGSVAGKIIYFILFIINLFITAMILWCIKGLIWLYHFIVGIPIWVWITVSAILILCIILVCTLLIKKDQK